MNPNIKDLTGQRFGRLVVLEITDKRQGRGIVWKCQCDCGNITLASSHSLVRGDTQSCGCYHGDRVKETHRKNLVGQRFGRLVVLFPANEVHLGNQVWECLCDCGNRVRVRTSPLLSGNTQSCGCLQKERQRSAVALSAGQSAFNRIVKSYRYGAKKRNLAFELTNEEVRMLTESNCFYCGIGPSTVKTEACLNGVYVYNGIDRIDNSKGYTKDNVVPCCKTCNIAKHDMTQEEFSEWISRLYHNFVEGED